eukprot:TRINITY_DN2881_c0_g2_i1.p1 TRINITY_DN2881_c0_g2~~TRINITY_DN2881_c0_g2_i1.p1  ORF type:complete len:665 (+),score=215.81 TRINITY_DN2881_c0_g2_i1:71-2065(+)
MKSSAVAAAVVLAAIFRLGLAVSEPSAPVEKVVAFIKDLKKEIESDAAAEKSAYAAFKAWCNETVVQSTADISLAEQTIEQKNRLIEELSGSNAASSSQIQHAQKNMKENKARHAEFVATREKELKEFQASADDLTAQIKSVSSALAELQPSNSTGFLAVKSDRPSAQGAVRQLLKRAKFSSQVSADDLQLLSEFAKRARSQQLMQLDTEPESSTSEIVGVISQVKENFEKELASAKADEGKKVKNFAELIKTIEEEHAALKTSLTELTGRSTSSVKDLADAKTVRDESQAQLVASKKLLTETQDSCKLKADEFAERTTLRLQELKGIDGAIDILTSKSKASFVQLAKKAEDSSMRQENAYRALEALAAKLGSASLAQLARRAEGSGFDQVVDSIKQHIKHLKKEEKEDVEHRDRCKKQMADSAASLASLEDGVKKTGTKIELLEGKMSDLQAVLATTRDEVNKSKLEIAERTQAREEERKEHLEVLKHNKEGLQQLEDAMATITKFYKDNKIAVGLAAEKAKPAPDAGFKDGKYKGSQATNTAVTMLKMVHEDLAKDIASAKATEESSQGQYEKDYAALKELLTSKEDEEISTNKALADLQMDLQGLRESKDMQADQKATEEATEASLAKDCAWVKANFASRRSKRKAEISGLVEAKALLDGK